MYGCAEWFGNDEEEEKRDGYGGAAAPNIYLYPEEASNISVKLTILDEYGYFTLTEPEHGDGGWDVWVEPDGLIDGTYNYLYYAGVHKTEFQEIEGWAVEEEDVFRWFEDKMLQIGFNQNEIDDFIEYWLEHLPPSPCYHIYPQDTEIVDARVAIDIIPEPDTLERLWFFIDTVDFCEAILEPEERSPFFRNGFTVVEWGVFFDFK